MDVYGNGLSSSNISSGNLDYSFNATDEDFETPNEYTEEMKELGAIEKEEELVLQNMNKNAVESRPFKNKFEKQINEKNV